MKVTVILEADNANVLVAVIKGSRKDVMHAEASSLEEAEGFQVSFRDAYAAVKEQYLFIQTDLQ